MRGSHQSNDTTIMGAGNIIFSKMIGLTLGYTPSIGSVEVSDIYSRHKKLLSGLVWLA